MKTLILLSGGIDSVTALYYTLQEHSVTAALSFHYGSKHNDQELKFAAWHANQTGIHHEIISLDFINKLFKSDLLQSGGEIPEGRYNQENMQSTVVPFRNGIMLSIAAGLAESLGAEAIVIAAHSGDHAIYPDCRPEFVGAMDAAARADFENHVVRRHRGALHRVGDDRFVYEKILSNVRVVYEASFFRHSSNAFERKFFRRREARSFYFIMRARNLSLPQTRLIG